MKKQRLTEAQIVSILKQYDGGRDPMELCREFGISKATLYNWRKKYAGMDAGHLKEMKAIQDYFRRAKRDPSDVEFEMIAQTWSEHCVHKTFKARITLSPEGRGQGEGPRLVGGLRFESLKLFICGGPEMAPALPPTADNR